LHTACFIGKADFQVQFQAAWSDHRFINHVDSIGHSNNQNIVKRINTIKL
jgi:hypothetical protein